MDDKNSFVVYTDIKEVVDELDDEQVAALFRAMLDYQITGKVPKLTGSLKYIFIPIRQQMDRNNEKWQKTKEVRAESGRRGGLKSAETRFKQKQANEANASFGSSNEANEAKASKPSTVEANEANEAVTVTVTDTVTVNGTVTDTVSASVADETASYLIGYLNEKTGSNYAVEGWFTDRVRELTESGYNINQFRTVIDKQCASWLNDEKMRAYLRPSTLFGDRFAEYLAAPISLAAEREQKKAEDRQTLERTLSEKRQALADLNEALLVADKTERRLLRENIAMLEDSIGVIERRLA